jgi:parallel beta-helix repeat protein
MRRLDGIEALGARHLRIEGFIFRHMGDAAINLNERTGDTTVRNVIAYGNRQGVRCYSAENIVVSGCTLFRNENAGVYFGHDSANGLATNNVVYENLKGLRFGYGSGHGQAIDNVVFDNMERGLSIEEVDHMTLRGNRLSNNTLSQLLVQNAQYDSDRNCFENGAPTQLVAEYFLAARYKTLAEYQKAKNQDLHSQEGDCARLPEKIDVHKLQAEAVAYTERARRSLGEQK